MERRPPFRWSWLVAVTALGAVAFAAPQSASTSATPSPAASPSPTITAPATGPTLEGDVTGSRRAGGRMSIRVDASMPGGWDRLHLVEIAVVVGGDEVDRLVYDIEDAKATLDGSSVIAGTGGTATGDHLGIAGSRIVLTTGGANLSLRVDADVLSSVPETARFELSVTGDRGEHASIERRFEVPPPDEGPTWASVVTAAVAALLAGGFVGNLFASRRRPPERPSVYGTIGRRLDAERSSEGPR